MRFWFLSTQLWAWIGLNSCALTSHSAGRRVAVSRRYSPCPEPICIWLANSLLRKVPNVVAIGVVSSAVVAAPFGDDHPARFAPQVVEHGRGVQAGATDR